CTSLHRTGLLKCTCSGPDEHQRPPAHSTDASRSGPYVQKLQLTRSAPGSIVRGTPSEALHPSGSAAAGTSSTTRLRSRAGSRGDRKSTRLNSSHVKISYAVFS